MSYQFPKVSMANGQFGPTTMDHYYKPMSYHDRTAGPNKHKTKWALTKGEQYEVFRVSDENKWLDSGGLFSILDKGQVVLGENEERIAFFPNPVNTTDPYHGYPVTSSEYALSDALVERWRKDNIITERIYIKILRRQI